MDVGDHGPRYVKLLHVNLDDKSARANILKSDATIPEMTRVLSYMRGEL